MTTHSQTLDRPALWLSLLGGSVAGLISVRVALWSALTHQPMDMQARHIGHLIGGNLGNLVIPPLVALLARRRYFLWACLAIGVKLFWTLTDRIVAGNGPGFLRDLIVNGRADLTDLLAVAGTASLIRFLVVRKRERAAAVQEARNQMLAAQYPPHQEGVWPPPPTRPADT